MIKYLINLLIVILIFTINNPLTAEPKRVTKCAKKVLLPGQKKPIKCRKARMKKNAYF